MAFAYAVRIAWAFSASPVMSSHLGDSYTSGEEKMAYIPDRKTKKKVSVLHSVTIAATPDMKHMPEAHQY